MAAIGGDRGRVKPLPACISLTVSLGVALGLAASADARDIPLPPIRPPSQPAVVEAKPSPCQMGLVTVAQFDALPPREGVGGCGAADLVRLKAVLLADGNVEISPPAELRCSMAAQVAIWLREDAAPQFAPSKLVGIDNYDSYDCRGRNRVIGAKVSEHGKGNALDVRAFRLAGGKTVMPTDVEVPHALRAKLRELSCARFNTVLGPGSDGYHEAHIHLDLADRRNGYRICHWVVRDAAAAGMARADIPLPQPRPYDLGNDKPNQSSPR
jgi:hypothetical protein